MKKVSKVQSRSAFDKLMAKNTVACFFTQECIQQYNVIIHVTCVNGTGVNNVLLTATKRLPALALYTSLY